MLIERAGDPDFVKVVDFGIAKVAAKSGPILTTLGSVFGTPEYMAPEQARGAAVDARTDLYTLGTVLYEMLVGRTPFAHEQFGQVLMGQISKQPPPLPPEIEPELAALVMQLLAKGPADRVQTAEELFTRLHAILARLAPNHPVLAAVPAGPAMLAAPSAQQPSVAGGPGPVNRPAPAPPMAAAPASSPTHPVSPAPHVVASRAPHASVPNSTQASPAPSHAVGTTKPSVSIGCAIALIVLLVVVFVLVRWIAAT